MKPRNHERDVRIQRDYDEGFTFGEIALEHNISRQRVEQIIRKPRRAQTRAPYRVRKLHPDFGKPVYE